MKKQCINPLLQTANKHNLKILDVDKQTKNK